MDEKRRRAKEFLNTVDWDTYDFSTAPGADMSFPDFDDGEDRPVWFPTHYNKTSGMKCRHVPDLNAIDDGKLRRLWALYGIPVEWDFKDKPQTAQFFETIEAARAGGPQVFAQTLSQYGLINEEHLEWMKLKAKGPGAEAKVEAQALLDTKMEELKQERQARIDGELKGELQPVEGVSVEQWAGIMAGVASGQDVAALLQGSGMDQGKWDRVSQEWNARMARDTTATIASVYGQAFAGAGQGQFGAAGQSAAAAMNPGGSVDGTQEPIPFERWIEVTVAQEAASERGEDPAQLLAQFGMSPADWGTAGGWWGQKFAAHAMDMMDDYNSLTAKYRAKYGLQDTDETGDELEERVKNDIIRMAKSDRGREIMPYLKKTFPDDADDNDALDHHLDQAADVVGEQGDRNTALVILNLRFDLADTDDPREEWIESEMDMLF